MSEQLITSGIAESASHFPDVQQDPVTLSRVAITKFLSEIGVSCDALKATSDESVNQQARKIIESWDVGEIDPLLLNAAIDAAIGFGTIAYAHTSHGAQVFVSLYTFVVIIIDDHACPADALYAFAHRMRTGIPQIHPLLDRLVELLDSVSDHYPAIAAREITRYTLAFVDSCALECEGIELPLRPGSYAYVFAKRLANGIGRAYANFVWDKANFPNFFGYAQATPDMEFYFDYSNDILSFYKEELSGEKHNFISERAVVTKRGTAGALFDTVDETVASVKNMRSVLEGTKELEACEAAIEGVVLWHRFEKRYKLAEVLGGN